MVAPGRFWQRTAGSASPPAKRELAVCAMLKTARTSAAPRIRMRSNRHSPHPVHVFQVVPCAKTFSHKWTLCPCAHIGETARRRCPRTVNYKAVLCPLVKAVSRSPWSGTGFATSCTWPHRFPCPADLQKKTCPLGDACGYAHNVFEHWLHPSRCAPARGRCAPGTVRRRRFSKVATP
jgi:hypothetical protein